MGRGARWLAAAGAALFFCAGCQTKPIFENPAFIRYDHTVVVENPVWLPSGPTAYSMVFEHIVDVVNDYFEIRYANRYDGVIETYPRIAPGFEQPWKPGSPDFYQRLQATLQTIRHRCEVQVDTAPDGGFFVGVTVHKELEDLPRPTQATAGAAAFRNDSSVDRTYQVVEPNRSDPAWIPVGPDGRDRELEQLILQRLKSCF